MQRRRCALLSMALSLLVKGASASVAATVAGHLGRPATQAPARPAAAPAAAAPVLANASNATHLAAVAAAHREAKAAATMAKARVAVAQVQAAMAAATQVKAAVAMARAPLTTALPRNPMPQHPDSQLQEHAHPGHGNDAHGHGVAKFRHRLRVCNAYANSEALDIYHEKERITDTPMLYKTCGEFEPMLRTGDRLQFEIGGANAGSFAVSELPNNDAVLVLVVYRHDATSPAVAFESHVFANLINAQIAVIDTYKGNAKAFPRIQDAGDVRTSRSEELRYDSVVAVNPGTYEVVLQGEDGDTKARRELVALNRESYIVVRCGVEAHEGRSYSQDLIVFPHSDPQALMGSAGRQARPLSVALALVLALALAAVGIS